MYLDEPLLAAMKRRVRRRALGLTALFWSIHLSLLVVVSWLDRGETLSFYLGHGASAMFGLGLCCLVYLVLERLYSRPFRSQALAMAALATTSAIAFSIVRLYSHRVIGRQGADIDFRFVDYLGAAGQYLFFFLAWAGMIIAVIHSFRIEFEQAMRMEAQATAHRAQMEALHYQINPHFLFNTLNSIAALVLDNKPKAAEGMIRKIADFLRRGLASDPFEDVTLRAEVEQQKVYLDIERVRFSDRLVVDLDIDEAVERAVVPSLILQPLVENAIKHAVAPSTERTAIRISAFAEDDMLNIKVRDDGAVPPDQGRSGTGIGLRNIDRRLAARYGETYRLEATPLEKGFEVLIRVPLRLAG